MIDAARLSEICRRADTICKKHGSSLTCDVFDAADSKYALLYPDDPPTEDQVVVTVTAQPSSEFDGEHLVHEIEQMEEVWRVLLSVPPTNSLS